MAEMNENAEKMNFHAEENREEMKSSAKNVTLTPYDELLLGANSMEIVQKIQIDKLIHFQNHPFRIKDDEEMEKLVQSIAEKGVVVPIIARAINDEYYEIISGHRRRYACMKLGIDTMPVIIRKLDDDEAVIAMVDSNIQREHILPSERGFSYKMKLEAIKHQGKRKDLTCSQVGNKLQGVKSSDELAEKVGESKNQIFRYIRLTELVPEILQMVDERQIAFRPAVEISYLSEEQQYTLLEAMGYNDATPSLAQAIKMKKFMQEGKLTDEVIQSIMQEDKPNQKEKPAFKD